MAAKLKCFTCLEFCKFRYTFNFIKIIKPTALNDRVIAI